ncbi:hypothetical protein RJ639_012520 [Escallonia herrerae]|uniref:Uncharacterized protein n=1 Tax=Escallonia herrerae TaxID=1293975 RepID=A0AA88VK33_9ASTE|nr:hypothetical protein RJ639_012520 [Escallonia herrerae]
MYRLNIGGPTIRPNQDSDLRRTWEMDSSYMVNADAGSEISNNANITYASPNDTSVAPLLVYRTARSTFNTEVMEKRFNMSWKFEVDPDFDYLIRLHFCELVFGGMNKAYHRDYFDGLSSNIKMLWIQLGPNTATGSAGTDALLNGLEIFKLSKNGNVAYIENYGNQGSGKRSRTSTIWVSIGAGIASTVVLAALVLLTAFYCKKRRNKQSDTKKNSPGWRPLFLHGAVQLTEKSDVYSFGVVLFEVVCARAVINPSLPKDQINLAEWAMRWQRQRSLETILDPNLEGKYSPESLVRFAEIAEKCLADEGKSRPTMGEVLWHLEYVLQVQEAWLRLDAGDESFARSQVLRNLEEREAEEMHEDAGVDDEQDSLDAKTEDDSEATVRETNRSGAVTIIDKNLCGGAGTSHRHEHIGLAVGHGYRIPTLGFDASGISLTANLQLIKSSSTFGPDIHNLNLVARFHDEDPGNGSERNYEILDKFVLEVD